MNIENEISDVITKILEGGMIQRLVAENLEKGVNKSLENLLGSYGDVTKVIEGKIKEVMVKQLSSYDYSEYVIKLDYVLTEILKKTSLDHAKILGNFKELMTESEFPKVVKVSEIFEEFGRFVSKNVETDDLEVDTDDRPTYESIRVTLVIEHEEERSWSSFKGAKIVLECEKDEELNCEIRISKFKDSPWELRIDIDSSVMSLRYLDDFKIYLLKLNQSGAKIEIDEEDMEDYVEVEAEPEVSFG